MKVSFPKQANPSGVSAPFFVNGVQGRKILTENCLKDFLLKPREKAQALLPYRAHVCGRERRGIRQFSASLRKVRALGLRDPAHLRK